MRPLLLANRVTRSRPGRTLLVLGLIAGLFAVLLWRAAQTSADEGGRAQPPAAAKADPLSATLIRCNDLPFKTITWDNGTEFHGYRQIEQATGVKSFFAYPHHPWERGSNENFNGLARQYFRKGRSLARARQADCDQVAAKLNSRPRKRYGFQTPIQRMQQLSGVLHLGC